MSLKDVGGGRIGDRAADKVCRQKLEHRPTEDFREGLHRYFTDQTKGSRLSPERDAAYVSLAYNVGIRGAGRSTATRRLNAGDIASGCQALTWWNKAGGRVVRGLVRRRTDEYRLCMLGVS
ncbi:glycoside hydrolase family protein [Pseudophaeobacter sp.]|uniref:glycoside hydrolase family protein n=1 Tax=Pseudophaeobacter sp. TaxID=1971739 RepID=UPI00329A0E50